MENRRHTIIEELRKCSYRHLQQLSKHYGLPSNYKKLYLIQLIVAKKLGEEESVTAIIEKVTKEREIMKKSKNRTRKYQMKNKWAITKYNTRQSVLARLIHANKAKNLDAHKTLQQYENLSLSNYQNQTNELVDEQIHNVKLQSPCIMKYEVNGGIIIGKDNVKVMYNTSSTHTIAPLPAKRQSILGYPWLIKPYPILKLQQADLTLRRNDGTVSKINAFIQEKPPPTSEIMGDVLQDHERNNSEHNFIQINMSKDSAFSEADTSMATNDGIMYYDETYKQNCLPKIADVFNKFHHGDYEQQLSVSVESDNCLSPYMPQTTLQNIQLETIYNIKPLFTNSSLLQISTKYGTTCTNSTKTIMSTKVHPTSTVISHTAYPTYDVYGSHQVDMLLEELMQQPGSSDLNIAGYDVDGSHQVDMLLEELMQQPGSSDLNIAESSATTSFDRNVENDTISEMLEDAMEIISEDEEYMNCEDNTKVSCVLCNWRGPGFVIDYHMQKIHENEVMKQVTNNWNITFTLGELVQEPLWCSRVLKYESIFYILSAKYEEPDVFMATLTSQSTENTFKTGSITVINKTTREPFTWEGEIKCLTPDWPQSTNINGLKINLSKLDLLPQKNPIAGQQGLNDVHIILFARLYN